MTEEIQTLKGKKVLVVDDSIDQRKTVESLYREIGCVVIGEAEDGLEALDKIVELSPDIVSLDIIMPNMDGIECYEKILEKNLDVKVLFLSCLAKNSEVREVLTRKLDSSILLPKPCEKDVLIKALLGLYVKSGDVPSEQASVETGESAQSNL